MSATLIAWSVTYLIHSTLLIAAVAVAARFIRSASARDTLWKIALLGGIVTATLQMMVPPPPRVSIQRETTPAPSPLSPHSGERVAEGRVRGFDFETLAFPTWLAIAAILTARIAIGRRRFLRSLGDRTEILLGPDRDFLDRLATRPVRLTESSGIAAPVAMLGWEIVIPAGVFARLTDAQRETILAHELSHLTRRDPLWLTLGELAKAALFFQPLNRLVQIRMKETAEFLCDDAAVLQTGNQQALAETLTELAANLTPSTPAVAAMAETGSNLIARVTRVLRSAPSTPLHLAVRVAIAVTIVFTTALFAPGMVVGAVKAAANEIVTTAPAETTSPPETTTGKSAEFIVGKNEPVLIRARSLGNGWHNGTVVVSRRGPCLGIMVSGGTLEVITDFESLRVPVKGGWSDAAPRENVRLEAPECRARESAKGSTREWDGNVSYSGEQDGVPLSVRINVTDLFYDENTGEIDLRPRTSIEVYESLGERLRRYELTRATVDWRGDWDGVSDAARSDWLRTVLHKYADMDHKVIDSILER